MSNQVASPIETGAGHRKATHQYHRPAHGGGHFRGQEREQEVGRLLLQCFALCGRCWLSKGKDCSWTLELPHPKHSVLPKHIRQETSNPNKPGRMLTGISSSAQRRMHTSAPERTGCLTIDQGILISSELAGSRRAGKSFFFRSPPPPTSS